jgi:Ca2+-transporting ATPase
MVENAKKENSSSFQSFTNPHALSEAEFLDRLATDTETGLSDEEASQLLEKYGPNKIKESKQKPTWKILIDQLTSMVMYLLAGAATLSFAFGDISEGIAIVVVMLINVAIGFGMEYQARKSMEALKSMDKLTGRVLRNGREKEIDAEGIVPGDIVLLASGALVPADLRLFQVSELQIKESPLTGESVPVDKNTEAVEESAPTADRTNMAFKGTSVSRGKGKAVVVATGMDTEIGKVTEMVSSAGDEEIPLNKKLGKLSQKLIWLVLGMATLLGMVGFLADKDLYQIIQTSIAWAIAAIPEGLPIVASIALARGMLRLADHNVVVKRLASVETLGETNIIFTDKTGTLTQNRLTVEEIFLGTDQGGKAKWNNDQVELEGLEKNTKSFRKLFEICVLANEIDYNPEEEDKNTGDPLEIGLLRFTHAFDQKGMKELAGLEFVGEDPFDSENKMMGTVYKMDDQYFVAGKGATGSILEACTRIIKDDEVLDISKSDKTTINEQTDKMAEKGLRTLAFAYRQDAKKPDGIDDQKFLENLIFVGLIGFVDPPANGVRDAIKTCRNAGIEVVMVTGDHPGTALNIARQVSLVDEDDNRVIHGKALTEKKISNESIAKTHVFSRVDPSQKLDLIESFQDQNNIVGMTGDGVNDAPALKKADIGIAMGKRGTQVAKEVADMVLQDDSFISILQAIREGRIIFGNIRKFIIYQLSYHFSEILVIALVMLVLFTLALEPLQLLYLNILLDVFPALALGVGRGRSSVMKAPPKKPDENIITQQNWKAIIVFGVIIAASVSGVYFYGYYQMGLSSDISNNVAFFSLSFAQLLNVLNMRDPDENVFVNQVSRNKWVWIALALCLGALLGAYFIPGLNEILSLQEMESSAWVLVFIGAITPTIFIQVVKQWVKS